MSRTIFRNFSIYTTLDRKLTPESLKSKTKNISSQHWLARQLSDPYVEKAKQQNYRCRSAFKLLEIDEKFDILKPGHVVIDIGAAPGSWSQIVARKINSNGQDKQLPKGIAIAVDKQNIYPIEGVTIFGNMDFTNPDSVKQLKSFLAEKPVNTILSDMAPSNTGIKEMDSFNLLKMCYSVLRFALEVSEKDSTLLVKLWQCGEVKALQSDMSKFYNKVRIVKPKSSRSDSAEMYLLGREFKGLKVDKS